MLQEWPSSYFKSSCTVVGDCDSSSFHSFDVGWDLWSSLWNAWFRMYLLLSSFWNVFFVILWDIHNGCLSLPSHDGIVRVHSSNAICSYQAIHPPLPCLMHFIRQGQAASRIAACNAFAVVVACRAFYPSFLPLGVARNGKTKSETRSIKIMNHIHRRIVVTFSLLFFVECLTHGGLLSFLVTFCPTLTAVLSFHSCLLPAAKGFITVGSCHTICVQFGSCDISPWWNSTCVKGTLAFLKLFWDVTSVSNFFISVSSQNKAWCRDACNPSLIRLKS